MPSTRAQFKKLLAEVLDEEAAQAADDFMKKAPLFDPNRKAIFKRARKRANMGGYNNDD